MLRQVRAHVEANAGLCRRPLRRRRARKIHYGEVEAHGIYGEASLADARRWPRKAYGVHPLPALPEEGN